MRAVFALLAGYETENRAARITLEAGLGFEANRLPYHVSLKQSFRIADLKAIETYFDEFAASMKPVAVHFQEIVLWPSRVFGQDSGVMVVKAEKSQELFGLHRRLNRELEARFGSSPANFDGDDYAFHMTVAIGGKPFADYQKAYERLDSRTYNVDAVFDQLGLFYYDEDEIKPGSYFCYKKLPL